MGLIEKVTDGIWRAIKWCAKYLFAPVGCMLMGYSILEIFINPLMWFGTFMVGFALYMFHPAVMKLDRIGGEIIASLRSRDKGTEMVGASRHRLG